MKCKKCEDSGYITEERAIELESIDVTAFGDTKPKYMFSKAVVYDIKYCTCEQGLFLALKGI